MMKKKKLLSIFLVLFIGVINSSIFAQNPGVDYFSTGELEIAKGIFEKQLSENPAEANYYLGEIAFVKGNFAEAKSFFDKGLAASPDFVLNNVGLGKLLLKSDTKAAEDQFAIALKKDKKDVRVLVAIAQAYSENGMKDKADAKLVDARKADKKSPLIYTLEGDILKRANDAGGAAGQYAQAINFDPGFVIAYIKTAQVYESINPNSAIDNLTKALEVRPDYTLAHRSLGNIYYKEGQYAKAIAAYKAFFEGKAYSIQDLTNYAAALYFSKNYDEAKALIEEGLAKDPNNFVLNRLLMYNLLDLENYERGLDVATKFFSINKGTSEYISRDHITFAEFLAQNDQNDKAMEQYALAIKLDPERVELYKQVAEMLAGSGQTAEGAEYFKKYIELSGEKAEALDYFNMGRYYYMAASSVMKDTTAVDAVTKAKAYLAEADKAFTTVAERVPDSHLGQLWRARANAMLDVIASNESQVRPTLAKPYYEALIDIILAKADNNNINELKEAYRYLSSYYYLSFDATKNADDKAKTILYSEKLLELDPENAQAKQLIDAFK